MSRAQETAVEQLAPAEPERWTVAGTRVDHAHVKAGSPPPELVPPPERPRAASPPAVELPSETTELQTQAEQLAAHLRVRQDDLNRREADLHIRLAELDVSLRSARLWHEERRAELAERETELAERERGLEERLGRLAQAEAAHSAASSEAETAQRRFERQAARREAELAEQVRRLVRQAEALAAAQAEFQTRRERLERELLAERQQIAGYRQESLEIVRLSLVRLEEQRKIADHYRLEMGDLTEIKAELETWREERRKLQDDVRRLMAEPRRADEAGAARDSH